MLSLSRPSLRFAFGFAEVYPTYPPPMAVKPADDFEIEYYLTPDGWKRGSEWFFGQLQAETPPPADCVLTLRKKLFQLRPDAAKEVTWRTMWSNPRFTQAQIEALRSRFGQPEAR